MQHKCICGSQRILSVSGKVNDLCSIFEVNGTGNTDGYVPNDFGIGGGDYLEFNYCLDCGRIQGNFPKDVTFSATSISVGVRISSSSKSFSVEDDEDDHDEDDAYADSGAYDEYEHY